MRILLITAGAGGMYCGSCLRDNALAGALMAKGHDVSLIPLYTPTLTDEPNLSEKRVFFGGISVYLQQNFPFFRRSPWMLDRLWDFGPLITVAADRAVKTAPEQLGELTVSMLEGEDGFQRKEFRKLTHWLRQHSPPDVINLPNSLLIGLAKPLKREFGCPLVCTLQGEDLFLRRLEEPYRSTSLGLIRANVEYVDTFVAVSHFYADFMSGYLNIPSEKIQVVPLGINPEGYGDPRPSRSTPFRIGYLARIAPEKGLELLCEAYCKLRGEGKLPESRLEVAGSVAPQHEDYFQGVKQRMDQGRLSAEFHYHGTLDRQEKIAFLQNLDLFSVPATYDEPKGMFVLEAMAAGVPVVQPRRGVFEEIIERTAGGILFEPNSSASLVQAIVSIYEDPGLAEQLGRRGFEGVRKHYTASQMGEQMLQCYTRLLF